jgi:hypothetical protein
MSRRNALQPHVSRCRVCGHCHGGPDNGQGSCVVQMLMSGCADSDACAECARGRAAESGTRLASKVRP